MNGWMLAPTTVVAVHLLSLRKFPRIQEDKDTAFFHPKDRLSGDITLLWYGQAITSQSNSLGPGFLSGTRTAEAQSN